MILAAMKGRDGIVGYLLRAGADPNIRAKHKEHHEHDTALGWARRLGHAKVVAAMIAWHNEVVSESRRPDQPPRPLNTAIGTTPTLQPSPMALEEPPSEPASPAASPALGVNPKVTQSEAIVTNVDF